MSKTMDFGNLYNQNIKVERHLEKVFNQEHEIIKLINIEDNMTLAEFMSTSPIITWVNSGDVMNRQEWDPMIQNITSEETVGAQK